MSTGSTDPQSLFVTIRNEILIPSSSWIIRIDENMSSINSTTPWCGLCADVFVDINDMFYCSLETYHKVLVTLRVRVDFKHMNFHNRDFVLFTKTHQVDSLILS